MKNHIIADLASENYHSMPEISKHGLDLVHKCPALYKYKQTHKDDSEQSPALRWGTLVHTRVLEPAVYHSTVVVAPQCDRRTKAGKEIWEEFTTFNAGKTIITEDEFTKLSDIAIAIGEHAGARTLLDGDVSIESSMFWTDEETGVQCRARPDIIRPDGLIVDLKTTQDASSGAFAKSCAQFRYHVQAAFYMDGLAAQGVEVQGFAFIAVEKDAPHLIATYVCDRTMLEIGRQAYQADLRTYAECKATNIWPGYPETIEELTLPRWAL